MKRDLKRESGTDLLQVEKWKYFIWSSLLLSIRFELTDTIFVIKGGGHHIRGRGMSEEGKKNSIKFRLSKMVVQYS